MENVKVLLKKHLSSIIFIIVSLTAFITLIVMNKDNSDRYKKYNGLIVTDKQGNSYMIRGTQYNFIIHDFDVNKMRLIE